MADSVPPFGWTELSRWGAAPLPSPVLRRGSPGRGSSEGGGEGSAGAFEDKLSAVSEGVTVLEAGPSVRKDMSALPIPETTKQSFVIVRDSEIRDGNAYLRLRGGCWTPSPSVLDGRKWYRHRAYRYGRRCGTRAHQPPPFSLAKLSPPFPSPSLTGIVDVGLPDVLERAQGKNDHAVVAAQRSPWRELEGVPNKIMPRSMIGGTRLPCLHESAYHSSRLTVTIPFFIISGNKHPT